MILLALFNTLILSFKFRQRINFSLTKHSFIGGALGVLLGALLIGNLSATQYQKIFGFLMLFAVSLSIMGITPKVTRLTSLIASSISGLMGTITSAGGAPMGLLYQSEEKTTVKANLSIYFVYLNTIAIVALWITGESGIQDLYAFVSLAPAVLIGVYLSTHFDKLINASAMRFLVLLVATLSGIVLVI
ncbi:TSUP family transporter [Alteromonas sp. LMIT007]|uniref:Probable membrane transporter protein n=2 Tax=Opacimonas viscosa TaxID=2961944 RepID=A0AA41WZG2_9ALTE|nr:TSUP family transporter [Opacimonas viscosa]